jgi:dephospho-CoA kinase
VLRIDHIGSTSVEGLPAKDLIDIQIMVPSDGDASTVAEAATAAGFVRVPGLWHGRDRDGARHPEQVCVDADPGRPVNINIRSADRPVARDALLFRDWLRASPDARARYRAVKSDLAGRQVDDYGDGKEPFISAALHEAEAWASRSGWSAR